MVEAFLESCRICFSPMLLWPQPECSSTRKTKLFDLTFEPLYCQVSYHAPRPTKNFATLDKWQTRPANNINYKWVSQNIDDHILLSFFLYWWMKKSVSISVYLENKTTKIRLSPCVHITFCSHLSLFTNVNFIRHRRMLSHLCRIRVLWFPP